MKNVMNLAAAKQMLVDANQAVERAQERERKSEREAEALRTTLRELIFVGIKMAYEEGRRDGR